MIPYSLATVSLSILTYLLLVLMGSTCLSEAFRGQQVLLNHAKQKRKGVPFFHPAQKRNAKQNQRNLPYFFFEMFPLAIICFDTFWHQHRGLRKSMDDMETQPMDMSIPDFDLQDA